MASIASRKLSHLLVIGIPLEPKHHELLSQHFSIVEAYGRLGERDKAPASSYAAADVIYGLPIIHSFEQVPKLQLVQVAIVGADFLLENPMWKEKGEAVGVLMTTVAGVHAQTVSQYFVMTALALCHRLQAQIMFSQVQKRWSTDIEIGGRQMFVQELRGKMLGVIGYGHIGRECARLAAAFGMKVIVANSDGRRKPQTGYREAGMGDPDGSIPEEWYSSKDAESLAAFLSRCDILLLALPFTPDTRHILDVVTLAHLPEQALVINVGRGETIDTDALLDALNSHRLGGAALDVAEQEPLPTGHPLFGRHDVLLTPHVNGRTVAYYDRALKILLENVARYEHGEEMWNLVDYQKGY